MASSVAIPAGVTVTLDPGGAYNVAVQNTGAETVALLGFQRLRSGESVNLYPAAGAPVRAATVSGLAGSLSVTTSGAALTKLATTAARPSAAVLGQGGFYYDTTLNKPAWSDDAVWRDAAGVAV